MDKTAIKNFSVWARKALIRSVADKCGLVGVREDGIQEPLPQSTRDMQFFDAGTGAPAAISGDEIKKREALVQAIRDKERNSDYKTAYSFIVEQVAYTWFNRLIAIRFMEVNDYLPSRIRVLSSEQAGKLEPDILVTPFDAEFDFTAQERDTVMQWKDRGQKEDMDALFRLLFVKQCDALHEILPGLFQMVDCHDYTELLLNISFTDREGVVYRLVNDIPENNFDISQEGQVEIIGWMYQYYNTELKDDTFAQLKKNVKISKERIPAATQLFTPDWIVRYMVENSLGRIFVSDQCAAVSGQLTEQERIARETEIAANMGWRYYLPEAEQTPEVRTQLTAIHCPLTTQLASLKLIDPCMGSGHILVYAFDVLMQIYESQGYTQRDAAQSILANNLFGLDIDERAAQLAYFAVMMKARQYDRRILTRGIQPHVLAIQESTGICRAHLEYSGAGMSEPEKNTARMQLENLLETLRDAREYGSILRVENCEWDLLRRFVAGIDVVSQITLDSIGVEDTAEKLMRLIDVGQALAQKYDVVVTNPPYMGSSGMNPRLAQYVKDQYPDTKSDLFACFIEHGFRMANQSGFVSMITMESWMFLSSFEKMRQNIVNTHTIVNMVHMPYLGKGGTSLGINFGTAAVIFNKRFWKDYNSQFDYICYYETDDEGVPFAFPTVNERYKATKASNFSKIPGSPVAYWVSEKFIAMFSNALMDSYASANNGFTTGDNNLFLRLWPEVEFSKISFCVSSVESLLNESAKWFPYNKGGNFRKWYGNNDFLINYGNNGEEVKSYGHLVPRSLKYQFRQSVTWNKITSGTTAFRLKRQGTMFDVAGLSLFPVEEKNTWYFLALCNSTVVKRILEIISPTLNCETGHVSSIPIIFGLEENVSDISKSNIKISKTDWNSYETSWDFKKHPLV